MKRSLIVLCVAALLATIPLARMAEAGKPENGAKTLICHVSSTSDVYFWGDGRPVLLGRWIEVSENAVGAHADHGDSTLAWDLLPWSRSLLADYNPGIDFGNANAWFYID